MDNIRVAAIHMRAKVGAGASNLSRAQSNLALAVARFGLCAVKRRVDASGCESRPVTGRSDR
jgi:hypothetical protein